MTIGEYSCAHEKIILHTKYILFGSVFYTSIYISLFCITNCPFHNTFHLFNKFSRDSFFTNSMEMHFFHFYCIRHRINLLHNVVLRSTMSSAMECLIMDIFNLDHFQSILIHIVILQYKTHTKNTNNLVKCIW